MIKILILVSTINVGDVNHTESVVTELAKKIKEESEIIRIDANAEPEAIEKIYDKHSKQKHIVLAAGGKSLEVLKDILPEKMNLKEGYIYFGTHQYTTLLENVSNIDHVGIPKTELDTPDRERVVKSFPHYTLTFAVPNINPSFEELKKAYDSWELRDKYPVGKYIVVMLPGDAPDHNGAMQYFSKSSATKIAEEIITLWKQKGDEYSILVENGPRTGKFNSETGKIACKHEYNKGEDPDEAIDEVSTHFITKLKAQIPSEKVHLFNFSFEKNGITIKKISFNDQLLYLAKSYKDNDFVVPGESTSVIAQATLNIKGDHLIGVKPDSMSKSHDSLFTEAVQQNLISYFDEHNSLVTPQNPSIRIEDDSALVAGDIYHGFLEKFLE